MPKSCLGADLPITSGGIGASAAASVAVAKALGKFCEAKLSLDELNQLAFAGECCIHGTPKSSSSTPIFAKVHTVSELVSLLQGLICIFTLCAFAYEVFPHFFFFCFI